MPYSGKLVSGGRRNFKGCMESINYNGDNITDLVRRKKLEPSGFVSDRLHQLTDRGGALVGAGVHQLKENKVYSMFGSEPLLRRI